MDGRTSQDLGGGMRDSGRDDCFVRSLFFDLAKDLKAEDVQMTPWASALRNNARRGTTSTTRTATACRRTRGSICWRALRIVQTPHDGVAARDGGQHDLRQGTPITNLAVAGEPTWLEFRSAGGRATFIVETTLRDGGWLDTRRRPHSDVACERRFRRGDYGHLDLTVTISDRKAYPKA
jgi:hypothetical protein